MSPAPVPQVSITCPAHSKEVDVDHDTIKLSLVFKRQDDLRRFDETYERLVDARVHVSEASEKEAVYQLRKILRVAKPTITVEFWCPELLKGRVQQPQEDKPGHPVKTDGDHKFAGDIMLAARTRPVLELPPLTTDELATVENFDGFDLHKIFGLTDGNDG